MVDLSTGIVDPVAASSRAAVETPIDVTHLARMTLGDAIKEKTGIDIYGDDELPGEGTWAKRVDDLLSKHVEPDLQNPAFAHTLKGSSSGIGAFKVARAAEAVENAATRNAEADVVAAISRLGTAISEARAMIAELLRAH